MTERPPPAVRALTEEPPYHVFVLTALGLALAAGFMLATLVPLSIVLDWGWGDSYQPLVQAHGQAQVQGWLGLYIMGMAYRLMPRFSGRPLRFPPLIWSSWALLAAAVVLRLAAQHSGEGLWQRAGLVGSGALGLLAALSFALVVFALLLHRESRAEATGYFFLLGAGAFVLQAAMSLALLALAAQRGQDILRPSEAAGLLHLQFYGFVAMFVLGVATRAVPTFSGLPRPELGAKALALALAAVVLAYLVGAQWVGAGTRNAGLFRLEAAAFAALGPLFLFGTWLVGIFRPAAIRVAAASQQHVWFIRAAFFWLVIGGGLAAYYGVRAGVEGGPIDQPGVDALRHTLGLGFATVMVAGMSLLVLPEFAIRRMRYPSERALPLLLLVLLNLAAALRVSAAVATPHWVSPDRYWPMAVAGGLAWLAIALFLALFLQSWREKESIVASQVPQRAARPWRAGPTCWSGLVVYCPPNASQT